MFVVIEYLTLDGRFTKIFGHHFMLVNYFKHRVRISFPFYLRQLLDYMILSIQNDPEGDHAFHEGLMVLIMNLLKDEKVDMSCISKKTMDVILRGVIRMRVMKKKVRTKMRRRLTRRGKITHLGAYLLRKVKERRWIMS